MEDQIENPVHFGHREKTKKRIEFVCQGNFSMKTAYLLLLIYEGAMSMFDL